MSKKTFILNKDILDNSDGESGFEIKIPGFIGDPSNSKRGQVLLEYSNDTLTIKVWNNKTKPTTFILKPIKKD